MPDWSATLICPDEDFDGAPLLRREFALDDGHGPVRRATLHATAHGVFEAYLNGQPVSDDVLSPGWSSYEWRLRYRSYDVTALLEPTTVLGIALGNGWFRGRLGWGGGRAYYGDELGAFAQLEIEFTDGHVQTVVTDESWTAGPSAVVANDLYDGQTIDARKRSDAWLHPGFSGPELDGRTSRRAGPGDADPLHRTAGAPPGGARSGAHLDLTVGQDAGRLRSEPGGLGEGPRPGPGRHRGDAAACRGAGARRARRASAAYGQGHRPVRPQRWGGRVRTHLHLPRLPLRRGRRLARRARRPTALTAVVVHSELRRIGTFECSDELLNQLHRNVVWGTRGQLPRRADRLSAAGRAARLDR